MSSIFIIAFSGLFAGIVMNFAAWLLRIIGFTTLDLTKYFGCFFTHQSSGTKNFVAGFGFHIILSLICPFAYIFICKFLNQPITILNGVYVGIVHTFVTGSLLPIIDKIHGCVKHGTVPAMGFCAIHYGLTAFITWLAGHVIFSVAIFAVLIRLHFVS